MLEPPWQGPPAASKFATPNFIARLRAAKKSAGGSAWPRSGQVSSQRTSLADLQTQGMNQAAVPDEGHYPEAQVDDLTFGEMLAQDIEGLLRRLPMVTRENLGETNRRFFLSCQFSAGFKVRSFSDQFF